MSLCVKVKLIHLFRSNGNSDILFRDSDIKRLFVTQSKMIAGNGLKECNSNMGIFILTKKGVARGKKK